MVELLVAILVLGLVTGGIVSLFGSIQRIQVATSYHETATKAAEDQIEKLRNNHFNQLTPGEDIDFSDNLPEVLPDDSSGVVEVSEPIPGLRRVDVTVSYVHSGQTKSVKLSSMIGEIGITQ